MNLHEKDIQKKPTLFKTSEVWRTTEAAVNDVPFDPERDIADEDWVWMLQHLNYRREMENYFLSAPLAMHLLKLFPHRKEQLDITDKDWVEMQKILDLLPETTDSNIVCNVLAAVAATLNLFPERRDKLLLNDESKMKFMKASDDSIWHHRAKVNYAILFPKERYYGENQTPEEYWQKNQWIMNEEHPAAFAYKAACVSLLVPQHKADIKISPEMWKAMKSELDYYRANRSSCAGDFARLAYNMFILSAESAEIDQNGQIKITPKPKPLKTIEPLPQRPV